MSWNREKGTLNDIHTIHEYYMDIINCIPDVVYWIDTDCNLKGCNHQFTKLLGLKKLKDFKGTPYDQMKKSAHWSDERVNAFKLDDMNAFFSIGLPQRVDEKPVIDKEGNNLYFQATRVPMYDNHKKVVGLVVVLTDVTARKSFELVSEHLQKEPLKTNNLDTREHLPTVLMIEDNLIAQNVEKALLTALNCHVDIAESGNKALKLFNPGKYDLVLMDLGLEDTSGYLVAKQLRNMEKDTLHHVPIIALTGYQADLVKSDCEQYFMEGAITKPLTSEQAEQIIKHYVYHIDTPVNGLKR